MMLETMVLLVAATVSLLISILLGRVMNFTPEQSGYSGGAAMYNSSSVHAGWSQPDALVNLSAAPSPLVFMQVSDLHISKFWDSGRITQLGQLINYTVPIIQPRLVLVTGDITDGKYQDSVGSTQFEEEWIVYHKLLVQGNVNNRSFWLDLRGNHDVFDVSSSHSRHNYYRRYSTQGFRRPGRSYTHRLQHAGAGYSFIALDATLDPGPRRPFNFVGRLQDADVAELQRYRQQALAAGDQIVWFGHYPTSTILHSARARSLLIGSLGYLCGHLHNFIGLAPAMYVSNPAGFMELELSDWKVGRRYRVLAIDEGILSFVDVNFNDQWPLILVTNPKPAQLTSPLVEPLWKMRLSTHIRLLVYSNNSVSEVRARVDDSDTWTVCVGTTPPMFTCPWKPAVYSRGLHTLQVYVSDSEGQSRLVSSHFSLDGSEYPLPLLGKLLLVLDVVQLSQLLFVCCLLLCTITPIVLRFYSQRVIDGRMSSPEMGCGLVSRWFRRCTLFSCVDVVFWPHIIMMIYMPVGPWLVGAVTTDHMGVVFVWGTYVAGAFLPGMLQYLYGALQLFTFHLPLMLGLGWLLEYRLMAKDRLRRCRDLQYCAIQGCLAACFLAQLVCVVGFWYSYDMLAVVLGPFRTWSLLIGVYMWWRSGRVSKSLLRLAAEGSARDLVQRPSSD